MRLHFALGQRGCGRSTPSGKTASATIHVSSAGIIKWGRKNEEALPDNIFKVDVVSDKKIIFDEKKTMFSCVI